MVENPSSKNQNRAHWLVFKQDCSQNNFLSRWAPYTKLTKQKGGFVDQLCTRKNWEMMKQVTWKINNNQYLFLHFAQHVNVTDPHVRASFQQFSLPKEQWQPFNT